MLAAIDRCSPSPPVKLQHPKLVIRGVDQILMIYVRVSSCWGAR